jgi:hypothetical protein
MFDGQIFKPTKKTGEQIMAWLAGGRPIETKAAPAPPAAEEFPSTVQEPEAEKSVPVTPEQSKKILDGIAAVEKLGITSATIWTGIGKETKAKIGRMVVDSSGLTSKEAAVIIDYLCRWADHLKAGKAKSAAKHTAEDHAGAEA